MSNKITHRTCTFRFVEKRVSLPLKEALRSSLEWWVYCRLSGCHEDASFSGEKCSLREEGQVSKKGLSVCSIFSWEAEQFGRKKI